MLFALRPSFACSFGGPAKSTPSATRLAMSVASGAAIALPLPSSRVMEPAAPSRWSGQVPRHGFRGGVRSPAKRDHSPRRSPSAPSTRGGRCRRCCFPRLGFPPLDTPLPRRPPFKAEIHRGGKPILGDTARLSLCCSDAALRPDLCRHYRGDRIGPWVAATTPPLSQSPPAPRERPSHRPLFKLPPV